MKLSKVDKLPEERQTAISSTDSSSVSVASDIVGLPSRMNGKPIGVLVRLFSIEKGREGLKTSLASVVSAAQQLGVCEFVQASESIKDPNSFVFYARWVDCNETFADEFNAFLSEQLLKKLELFLLETPEIECFEVFCKKEKSKENLQSMNNSDRFIAVADTQLNRFVFPLVRFMLPFFMRVASKNATNISLCAQQSLSRYGHLINYEEWVDYDNFINVEMNHFSRAEFKRAMDNPESSPSASLQFFRVISEWKK